MVSPTKKASIDYLQKVSHKGIKIKAPCPACGNTTDKTLYFKVRERAKSPAILDICRCDPCGSYFCHPLEVRSYESNMTDRFINFYIEIGGGVQCMLDALVSLPASKRSSMLEIGCGYGFSLDIWKHLNSTPAIGVEPSSYADRGKNELGVDIIRGLLSKHESTACKAGSYDAVVSFEVIEHVTDQAAFVDLASHYLKPDGVLLLSTPNALMLDLPSTSDSDLVQVLSPGHHTTVLSQHALSSMLKDAGFEHQCSTGSEYQQIIYASKAPLKLEYPSLGDRLEVYQSYLNHLKIRGVESKSTSLITGSLYRLFESHTNSGNLEQAAQVQEELESALKEHFKFYRQPVEVAVSKILGTWGDDRFLARLPHFAVPLEYYRAMIALLHFKDEDRARHHLRAVLQMAPRTLAAMPALSAIITPLLWRVRVELAKIEFNNEGQQRTESLKELKRLRKENSGAPASWKQTASIERLKLLMSVNRHREADEELAWLEQWFDSRFDLNNGDSVVIHPHHLADISPANTEEAHQYLWYLLLRGQLALKTSQQQPSTNHNRNPDYGIKALRAGEKLAASFLHSTNHEGNLKNLLPPMLETLAESYRNQNEYTPARHCLLRLLDLASNYDFNIPDKEIWMEKTRQAVLLLYVEENFDSLWESQLLEKKQHEMLTSTSSR